MLIRVDWCIVKNGKGKVCAGFRENGTESYERYILEFEKPGTQIVHTGNSSPNRVKAVLDHPKVKLKMLYL